MSLDGSAVGDVSQLSTDENEILAAPFTEKEVFEAVTGMK